MTKERHHLQQRYTELNAKCRQIEHARDTGQIPAEHWDFWRKTYSIYSFRRMLALGRLQRLGPVSEQQIAYGFPQPGQIPLPLFKELPG